MSEEEMKNQIEYIIEVVTRGDDYTLRYYDIQCIMRLLDLYKQEKEKYKRLSIEAQATAFEDDNIDTEGLLRVLLKQGEITLNEKGEYQRKDFDWEENMMQLGLMKKREKTFYIPDDECLDEYMKQLESQLKEYNELKRIFRERNITNETMYDGFCRLFDEVENLKQIEQSHKEENGKLRVEFEKVYEDNLNLANELEQEKEKNIFLEGYKVGAEEAIKELKEKNKDLQKQLNGAFDRGFISKDKIKEKIEQAKQKADDDNLEEYSKISAWKELLEEEQ